MKRIKFNLSSLVIVALLMGVTSLPASAKEKSLLLLSTTSTDNSGLFSHLLPIFEAKTGIQVKVVALGTGQALRAARSGDADVLLVHDRASELKFIADGYGIERREFMYNDFVMVGHMSDPAGINGFKDIVRALVTIKKAQVPFVSRGDDSGTHKAERRLWALAGIDPGGRSNSWYSEVGAGMGATLNIAVGMKAYTLSDRGTWLSFRNRKQLLLLVEGDPRLFNQYGIMLVNPAKHPHVRALEGRALIKWITSPEGQNAIGAFKIDGQKLFTPNYRREGS